MIYKIFLFLVGRCRFYADKQKITIINLLSRSRISADVVSLGDTSVAFDVPYFQRKRVIALFKKHGLSFEKTELFGSPLYFHRYKLRWGLILGCAAMIFIVYLSSSVVWRINVIGNETLDDEIILEGLSQLDFGIGSYIPSVNVKILANEYLLSRDELAWMSINIIGNCVDIRVKESVYPSREEADPNEEGLPSSIIAKEDGYIERIVLENGEIIRNVGSCVRKGETVVSGMVAKEDGSFYLVRSSAKVYAKTSHSFTVSIPLTQSVEKEIPLGVKQRRLVFFSRVFDLPFGSNTASGENEYTKSYTEYLTLPQGSSLPIGITTVNLFRKESQEKAISEEEAYRLALAELSEIIDGKYADCEVLGITKEPDVKDGIYCLDITLICLENIAKEQIITSKDFLSP